MEVKNRHKEVVCDVCGNSMRSDTLKRHRLIHKDLLSLPDHEIKEELRIRQQFKERKELRKQQVEEIARKNGYDGKPTFEQLEKKLLHNNKIYLDKIELGRNISVIIAKGVVQEESLDKQHQEALQLYRKRMPRFDVSTSVLRPWQQQALELVETLTDRKIIWIYGKNGNEGKSWFQSYIQGRYGFNRVVKLDLRIRHENLCNVLKKQSLSSLDIFLFNDARCVAAEDNLYRILENIKDGQATASKYNNDNIYFKTPNTVIIFSNRLPDTTRLSKDRWNILEIRGNKLIDNKKMTEEEKKKRLFELMEENDKKHSYRDNCNTSDSDSDEIVSGLYG